MNCLLCDATSARLQRDDDRWRATCPHCGGYAFDDGFAALVKHARANGQNDVLQQLTRLAALVQRSSDTLVIRRDNVVELLEALRSQSYGF